MLDSFNQLSYFQFSFFLTKNRKSRFIAEPGFSVVKTLSKFRTLTKLYLESPTPSPDRSGYPTVKPRTARNEPGAAERGVIAESRFPATKKNPPRKF